MATGITLQLCLVSPPVGLLEIESWWTSLLWCDAETVIALYADHGASEQFRSEFKTDLDIECLPSGKFATNALVLARAVLACKHLALARAERPARGADAPTRPPTPAHCDAGTD